MTMTKQRTRTDFLCLTISAGEGRERLTEHGANYDYTVSIQSDSTGARTRFTYHDSISLHDANIDQLDREGLLYAFWSFVSDAEAGDKSFTEFCDDYGYDWDSMTAKRTHDACRAARAKLRRLFHDDREPSTILELLALEGIE